MTGGLRIACLLGDRVGPAIVPSARRATDEALAAAGRALESGIDGVLGSEPRTPDLGGAATTNEFTDAVVAGPTTATSRPRGETR